MATYELTFDGSTRAASEAEMLAALQPLAGAYTLRVGPRRTSSIAYLDTADRRLRKRGLTLSYERAGSTGVLVLEDAGGTRTTTPLREIPTLPALADALPAGEVRDLVAEAMWIRAVAPVIRSKRAARNITVLNADEKTVVRLEWVEASEQVPPRVEIRPLRGYDRDGDAVSRLLLSANGSGGFRPAESTTYDDLLELEPAGTGRPAPTPGMPADLAVATALLGFLDDLEANVEGTVEDVDTEFLHDLRVAVRRTRSLVKLAGDVLPPRLVARYELGFKWLGDLTTPTRDLDVYQLEMPKLSASLAAGDPADLAPFATFLHRHRQLEWRKLVRGLKTQRFATLRTGWRSGLAAVDGSERTVDELAVERVGQAFKRVQKKARAITPESPSDDVHALRKRGKELRYALEVFGPLRGAEASKQVVKDLKLIQDTLGDFQDGEVQAAALRDFARKMPDPPAVTLLAMGELAAGFAAQQRKAREELTARLAAYLGGHTQERIKALLS